MPTGRVAEAKPRATIGWPTYAGLFALALAVRLVYLLEWHDTALFSVLVGDGQQYDLWAREIAGGRWYGTEVFYQAPLYPYFLAVIYRVLGYDPWILRLVQASIGSISCVLLALGGRRFFDARVGLTAGVLLALYGPAIYFDGLVQKGALDGLFMALLLLVCGEHLARRRWVWAAAIGATLGAFALTRENALILPVVIAAWLLVHFREEPLGRRIGWVVTVALGLALILVPVGLRNHTLGGRFLVTTSQLGSNFFIGNNENANGTYVPLRVGRGSPIYERIDATELAEEALGHPLSPAEVSRYWLGRGLGYARDNPAEWLALMLRKTWLVGNATEIMDTDSIEAYADRSVLLRVLGGLLHFGVLLPLALIGAWVTRGAWRRLSLLYVMGLAMAAAVAIFFVLARYRYPLVPIVALFAAAGLLQIVGWVRRRSWTEMARTAGLIAIPTIVFNWPVPGSVDPRSITDYSLGDALAQEGRLDEAREWLAAALARNPELVAARMRLGDVLTQQGRLEAALVHLHEAVRLRPDLADARTLLGTALLRAGDLDGATAEYDKAITLEPANASAHNNLAVIFARQGRFAEAVAHWEQSALADPDDLAVRSNLATVLVRWGEPARALAHFEHALTLAPGDARARHGLALALLALGQVEAAEAAYREALGTATEPLRGRIAVDLARMLAACRDLTATQRKEALPLIESVPSRADAPDLRSLDTLAMAYASNGRFEEAVAAAQRALELAVDSGDEPMAADLRARQQLYRSGAAYHIDCAAGTGVKSWRETLPPESGARPRLDPVLDPVLRTQPRTFDSHR